MNERTIHCSWCEQPLKPKEPRMKLYSSEGSSTHLKTEATFHLS
jgi:hypothetical protein